MWGTGCGDGVRWARVASRRARATNASFPEPAAPPAAAPPARRAPPAAPPPAAPPPVYTPPAAAPPVYTPPPAAAPAPAAAAPYAPPVNTSLPAYQPSVSGLAALPPLLPYRKGLPVPPGYRVVERAATSLTLGGGLTFAAAYLAGLGLAASQGFDTARLHGIQVAGPWAAIGGRTFKCKSRSRPARCRPSRCKRHQQMRRLRLQRSDDRRISHRRRPRPSTGAVIFFIGLASGYQELGVKICRRPPSTR